MAGLDDDWESVDLQPGPTQQWKRSLLDDDDIGSVTLGLDAPSAVFLWHASARSDVSRFDDIDAASLDQPVLDLDSDDEEMGEETVLDF